MDKRFYHDHHFFAYYYHLLHFVSFDLFYKPYAVFNNPARNTWSLGYTQVLQYRDHRKTITVVLVFLFFVAVWVSVVNILGHQTFTELLTKAKGFSTHCSRIKFRLGSGRCWKVSSWFKGKPWWGADTW